MPNPDPNFYDPKEEINKLKDRILFLEGFTGAIVEPEPTKWYENIPEGGVLCLCGDHSRDLTSYDLIYLYSDGDGAYKFRGDASGYKHAEPLAKPEIKIFMDNAPESENGR